MAHGMPLLHQVLDDNADLPREQMRDVIER